MHLGGKRRPGAAVVGSVALVAVLCRVRLVLIGNVGERQHQVLEAAWIGANRRLWNRMFNVV